MERVKAQDVVDTAQEMEMKVAQGGYVSFPDGENPACCGLGIMAVRHMSSRLPEWDERNYEQVAQEIPVFNVDVTAATGVNDEYIAYFAEGFDGLTLSPYLRESFTEKEVVLRETAWQDGHDAWTACVEAGLV